MGLAGGLATNGAGQVSTSELPSSVALTTSPEKVTGPWAFRTPPVTRGVITTIDPTKARSRNALAPLVVPSVDGHGQNVEPCVLYIPEGITDANSNTWKYLMVCADYYQNQSSLENPSIRVSNDGQTWSTVTGAPDPLVANPGGGFHNYDQSITIGPDGTIYVLYMVSDDATVERTYYITTTDLVNWTAPTLLQTNNNVGTEREQAPVAQWDGSQWHVWKVQFVPANPSAIIHYTGATIAAALAGSGTTCTINNQPATPTVLWEHNIIRVGEIWCGVITAKTGVNCNLYFMTSPDGVSWTMGTLPLLQPMAPGQGALWDKGLIYRSTIALLNTGRGGFRFGLWYGGADSTGTANWGIGYTEIWFADAEAPREAFRFPAVPSRYFTNPVITSLTNGALTLNNMYLYIAYSGEVGILINGLDLTVSAAGGAGSAMRGGLYICNKQSNPFWWAAGTAWGTLVSELAATFDGTSATHQLQRWAGTQNLWVPPRTWFGIAGACQGAAISIQQGKIANTQWSVYGAAGSAYNNTPGCVLFCTGINGALPQSFTPTGVGQVDNGLGMLLDSTTPSG
jgi:hypothetical protein